MLNRFLFSIEDLESYCIFIWGIFVAMQTGIIIFQVFLYLSDRISEKSVTSLFVHWRTCRQVDPTSRHNFQ